MRPSARQRANRLNAKQSSGPRSTTGKARIARNAIKHGLSIPVGASAGADTRIEKMALVIVGSDPNPYCLELARLIAEAQLDLVRIKEARRMTLESPKERLRIPKSPSGEFLNHWIHL